MKQDDLTLKNINKKLDEKKVKSFRPADFLSENERVELKKANQKKDKKKKFNDVDFFVMQIITYFGYDVYLAWKNNDIETEQVMRWIFAKNALDSARDAENGALYLMGVAGANNGAGKKGNQVPKSLKQAQKILSKMSERGKYGL